MKNFIALFSLFLVLSCTKDSGTGEEMPAPTTAEQEIIDAATGFFKSAGDYSRILDLYRIALNPILEVRRVLTEGACTDSSFYNQCCCPWYFSIDPYDAVNGNTTSYHYPKTALFTAKPGRMEGNFSAVFPEKPVASDTTEVQYNNFAYYDFSLNGIVSVKNTMASTFSNNPMCFAEFSNNSLTKGPVQIASISGHLSTSDGEASGKLDITYTDSRKIKTEIITDTISPPIYAVFKQHASFTINGITSAIDFKKQTITISERTFKLNL
jgi:hypothetical protein